MQRRLPPPRAKAESGIAEQLGHGSARHLRNAARGGGADGGHLGNRRPRRADQRFLQLPRTATPAGPSAPPKAGSAPTGTSSPSPGVGNRPRRAADKGKTGQGEEEEESLHSHGREESPVGETENCRGPVSESNPGAGGRRYRKCALEKSENAVPVALYIRTLDGRPGQLPASLS